MISLLNRILASAARQMWKEEPTLGHYTQSTAEHELNIAFHYASRLRRWLPWLDCDCEIQKSDCEFKRPDTVFHVRGIHELNILVVEVKRKGFIKGGQDDLEKIRNSLFGIHYLYQYGASIVFDEAEQTEKLCVIQRGVKERPDEYKTSTEYSYIAPPSDAVAIEQYRKLRHRLDEGKRHAGHR